MTDNFEFRSIHPDEVEQAIAIEQICFPPNEACSPKAMTERIAKVPQLFLVAIDKSTGKLAGFLNGVATDEEKFRDEFFTDIDLCDALASTILVGMPGLMMKFCPKPLESAKSYFSHRARITEMSVSSGMEAILSQKKAVAGYAAAFGGVLIIYCAAESAAASLCAVSAGSSGASVSGAVSEANVATAPTIFGIIKTIHHKTI